MKVHRGIDVHHIVLLAEAAIGEGGRLEDNRLNEQETTKVREIEWASAETIKTPIPQPQELEVQEEIGIYEDQT